MPTRRLLIKDVNRGHPIWVVKPTDFISEPSDEMDPLAVARDPKFSLYCFDPENDAAIFVESGDPAAVLRAPFYYQAQVQLAVGLVSMPLAVFHQVADEIPRPAKGFVFVHSVGRCGSTLVSKALEAVPSVHSLSEPDDLTQMVNFRVADGMTDAQLLPLLSSSVKWRGKARMGAPADFVALKMRSEVLVLADLYGSLFPGEKHLFLYRDGLAWMRSLFRSFPESRDVYDGEANRKMEEGWGRTLAILQEYRREDAPMNPVQVRALGWITCMEGYFRLRSMGVPVCAARFEDLTAEPEPILKALFEFCGIDRVDWNAIAEVLGRDSQAGTIYDREERRTQTRELTEELVRDLRAMIATRPLLREPDVVVPGTIAVSRGPA